MSLVERGGSVRSFHVAVADKATVTGIITANIARETRLHTDESRLYGDAGAIFAEHSTVRHSAKEYARGDVHINTVEGVFSIFKHCKEKHLHRYLAEYDFRCNHRTALGFTDAERTLAAVKSAEGSGSPIVKFTSETHRHNALRFLRWRGRLPKRGARASGAGGGPLTRGRSPRDL